MWTAVFSALASLAALGILIAKAFNRKARAKKKRIEEAHKLGKEGVSEKDPAKIAAFFNRLKRER